jgi:hypothetical protein
LVAQASGIHVDELAYNFVVGHFHDGRHARQPVYVYGVAEHRVHGRGAAVFSQVYVVLGFPVIEQAVQRIGHAFGQFDGFLAFCTVFADKHFHAFLRMRGRSGEEGAKQNRGSEDNSSGMDGLMYHIGIML